MGGAFKYIASGAKTEIAGSAIRASGAIWNKEIVGSAIICICNKKPVALLNSWQRHIKQGCHSLCIYDTQV